MLSQINVKKSINTSQFKLANTKSLKRIEHKAEVEYDGDYSDIRDVARGSIQLNDNEKIGALSAYLDWLKNYNVELPHSAMIVVSDNRFKKPTATGHSSHKVNIAIPIPGEPGRWHITEIMGYHGQFERTIAQDKKNKFKSNSHEAYEKYRYLEGVAHERALSRSEAKVLGYLKRTLKKIHNGAREKFNIDQIKRPLQKAESLLEKRTWQSLYDIEKNENLNSRSQEYNHDQ